MLRSLFSLWFAPLIYYFFLGVLEAIWSYFVWIGDSLQFCIDVGYGFCYIVHLL